MDRRLQGNRNPGKAELTNNAKLKKIRIALNLHEDAMLAALKAGGHPMSRSELTACSASPSISTTRMRVTKCFESF